VEHAGLTARAGGTDRRVLRGGVSLWARRLAPFALIAAVAAFLLFVRVRWPCPLLLLTGLPCPTCGLTRATRLALLHLDFAGATRMHPLWFVIDPIVGGLFLAEAMGFARTGAVGATRPLFASRAFCGLLVAVGIVTLAVWGLRFAGYFGGPVGSL
jgi:hypothetical protein